MQAAAANAGMEFGPYRIVSRLASGGMADVWLAETTTFGSPMRVVLKTMRVELASSRELSSMFVEEARLASRLRHPNVVTVLDAGAIDGRHYIAMEYVRGCTMRQIAKRYHEQHRRFDTWFLLRIALGATAALEYVHGYVDEEGWPLALVHGDVSPENIMVSFSGEVKLLDFGIARASTAGMVVGKPWYMAPERIRSGSIDGRSDLYSIGVILYEYLTGYRPYRGDNEAEVMARALEGQPPSMRELGADASDALIATTHHAMACDPADRFPSAAHLIAELAARLVEIDERAVQRPLDTHMAQLFGDREPVSSSIRLSPGPRKKHEELPTAPGDPVVVQQLIRQTGKVKPYRPDIFATAERPRAVVNVFGGSSKEPERATSPIAAREAGTDNERQASRLFEQGLQAVSLGDYEGAYSAWREAVALDPTQRRYESNLRRLEQRLGKK